MNPITIGFTAINDHLHSRADLSRLREPGAAEAAVGPAIKDVLESIGEMMNMLKEGWFQNITQKPLFVLSPGYEHFLGGLKFVYAMIALLSEGNNDVIRPALGSKVEAKNLRPLRSELHAVWSDIENAMRGLKDHSLHLPVLGLVLGLELSNFSMQLKLKPGNDDDHQMIVETSNDLWFRGIEVDEVEKRKRQNAKETKNHLEAMVLRMKPETDKWLHLTPRVAALGMDAFELSPPMIANIHDYLVRELNLAEKRKREVNVVLRQNVLENNRGILDTVRAMRRRF